MKTKPQYFFLLLIFILPTVAISKNLNAWLDVKTFYSVEKGPYIETYLSVAGKSAVFSKKTEGQYQASIEISLSFKLNNEIKYFDKYNLLSPLISDTSNVDFNFLDQQRVQLENGNYALEISISDKNSSNKPFTHSQFIKIEYYPNIISISDIELIESYKKSEAVSQVSKNGYDIIPRVNNFYSEKTNALKFYVEIYNTDMVLLSDPFLLTYFIETAENKRTVEKFKAFSKQQSKKLNVLLSEFPIADLPSGNYNLVVEVRNNQNDIIAFKELFFQRSNTVADKSFSNDINNTDIANTFVVSYSNADSLTDFINSLRPISNVFEVAFASNKLKTADVKLMQQFFYDFWVKRNAADPEKAWSEYHAMVISVNNDFKTLNKKGYETERGRVYLQYGPPNTMQREYHEPSSYPYEIWHYYKIGTQTNRKFVFFNPDLITNDFALLHSDALGENNDNQWQLRLAKRDTQTRDIDNDIRIDGFGQKVDQNFSNPR